MDEEEKLIKSDEGIFIKFNRTLGGRSIDVFVMSENLAKVEIKRVVEDYLREPSDTFIHGDLQVEEEKCHIWKPSKPLKAKVNIVLAETWESGCGSCWAYACRNDTEIKQVLRHVTVTSDEFQKLTAKIYRDVPVLRVATATEKDFAKPINRLTALKREL